jgi:hypothetical protein
MPYREESSRIVPATISLVIAIVCAIILGVMIYDRWHEGDIKSAEQTEHLTTGSSAGKAGAKQLPIDPKMSAEPSPSLPGSVQRAQPD